MGTLLSRTAPRRHTVQSPCQVGCARLAFCRRRDINSRDATYVLRKPNTALVVAISTLLRDPAKAARACYRLPVPFDLERVLSSLCQCPAFMYSASPSQRYCCHSWAALAHPRFIQAPATAQSCGPKSFSPCVRTERASWRREGGLPARCVWKVLDAPKSTGRFDSIKQ
ncbi:MAG: hypothetical protein JWN13_5490 [Betaproteobacteria bacterium]|nr:hypothetical protein [Betaproteobacteria bacterium]